MWQDHHIRHGVGSQISSGELGLGEARLEPQHLTSDV